MKPSFHGLHAGHAIMNSGTQEKPQGIGRIFHDILDQLRRDREIAEIQCASRDAHIRASRERGEQRLRRMRDDYLNEVERLAKMQCKQGDHHR